jgi:site-specific DNA-cytosine methylase
MQEDHPTIDANYYKGQSNQRRMLLIPFAQGGGRSMTKKHNWDSYPIEGRIRRLMPIECERLMSWPDGHTSKGRKEDGTEYEVSDTQRYKMCGNGVVSEVVARIVEQMYTT